MLGCDDAVIVGVVNIKHSIGLTVDAVAVAPLIAHDDIVDDSDTDAGSTTIALADPVKL